MNRRLQFSWRMSLLTLVTVLLFTMLGFWQLERAAVKQMRMDQYEARLKEDYQRFQWSDDWHARKYQKVILSGRYDPQRTLLLDNQIHQGQAGYHVLSPFALANGDWILVNRGWVALGASRQNLPAIQLPRVMHSVRGILTLPSAGFRMGAVRLQDHWPQVIPFIDFAALQPEFSRRLLPVVVWLAPESPGFYRRNWQVVSSRPEKSQAYAVQWFAFAGIALVLFFVLNRRPSNADKK